MLYYDTKHLDIDNYISNEVYSDFNCPVHIHNYLELVYIKEGELEVHIDDNTYILVAGDICLIKPMEAHSYKTNTLSKCQIVDFSCDYADEFVRQYKDLIVSNPIIKSNFNWYIMREISVKKDDFYLMKAIINFLISKYIANATFTEKNKKVDSFIKNMVDYIDNNYDKDISLESCANELGYTPTYLSALINKTFNRTLLSMVNEKRILKALSLLEESNMNITEIASLCGYTSLRSFNRNFKNYVGVSPTEFKSNSEY